MYNHQENMHQLIVKRLTGIISDEDARQLQEYINADEQVQWLWKEMENKWVTLEGNRKLEHLDPALELELLKQKLNQRSRASAQPLRSRASAMAGSLIYLFRKLIACK